MIIHCVSILLMIIRTANILQPSPCNIIRLSLKILKGILVDSYFETQGFTFSPCLLTFHPPELSGGVNSLEFAWYWSVIGKYLLTLDHHWLRRRLQSWIVHQWSMNTQHQGSLAIVCSLQMKVKKRSSNQTEICMMIMCITGILSN